MSVAVVCLLRPFPSMCRNLCRPVATTVSIYPSSVRSLLVKVSVCRLLRCRSVGFDSQWPVFFFVSEGKVVCSVLFRCRCQFCAGNSFPVAFHSVWRAETRTRRYAPGRIGFVYMLLTRTSRLRVNTQEVPGFWVFFLVRLVHVFLSWWPAWCFSVGFRSDIFSARVFFSVRWLHHASCSAAGAGSAHGTPSMLPSDVGGARRSQKPGGMCRVGYVSFTYC